MLFCFRFQLIENRLLVNSIEWDDQGMYQCFLTNDVGEDTRSTWLRIKSKSLSLSLIFKCQYLNSGEPPSVTVNKDLIVFNGTDVQLTCHVNGSPLPNITWFKRKYF